MDRHAAHRDRLARVLAALGQRDVEAGRCDLRIVEEQFEEVAHAVEEQGVAGLILEAPVLDHHRGWGVGAGHEFVVAGSYRAIDSRFGRCVNSCAATPLRRRAMSETNVRYTEAEALEFHSHGRPGKIEIVATKPMATQRDLSLAYSPGVAVPVRAIADNPACAYDYTSKGNLVAVISNGTAILGLGNLGALAAKPVMEGKAVLFKRFADVDAIDIEVATEDAQRFIDAVELLEPTLRRDQPRGHRRSGLLHH